MGGQSIGKPFPTSAYPNLPWAFAVDEYHCWACLNSNTYDIDGLFGGHYQSRKWVVCHTGCDVNGNWTAIPESWTKTYDSSYSVPPLNCKAIGVTSQNWSIGTIPTGSDGTWRVKSTLPFHQHICPA